MKQLLSQLGKLSFTLFVLTITTMFLASCTKQVADTKMMSSGIAMKAAPTITADNILDQYSGMGAATMWELQQARAASARYKHLKNAEKDGYVDINVVMPFMGYHFMKMDEVDGVFDYRKPEILVYNKNTAGEFELVAVEYAVPLTLSATAPAGFSGNHDVWNRNTGFGLWLLHAWVWQYNPQGVFNPTNSTVVLR